MKRLSYEGAGDTVAVPGTLRGYRFWRFDDDLNLYPVHVNLGPWYPGKNTAFCASDDVMQRMPGYGLGSSRTHDDDWVKNPAPQAGCSCGIYATYNPRGYRTHKPQFWMDYGPHYPVNLVHGSVQASGRVILGETGFKAAHAEVEAFWGWNWSIPILAEVYGVRSFRTRRGFLKAFPPDDVSALLEE